MCVLMIVVLVMGSGDGKCGQDGTPVPILQVTAGEGESWGRKSNCKSGAQPRRTELEKREEAKAIVHADIEQKLLRN
jgi:hypothetical protein